uniref:S-adenosylmethionine:tRNA ribosyltransferase-isomerase n=1 Tax=Candidatus Kentrum eta TaxID=2126337 RepID=A0A450UZF9_9GAMM|nr:MAG: S-adenosylmethionine:tRNA ribosyltransferase-isomerase [Candidatus Kentron sp. H]VFJ97835.1 MAG: S-adenosylmethionine:tRNA ribosyltransferase-isomerase [Candidatus Kentron sp. H]VFK03270.1 MAG: S-adenosylmethionine:tRNA ribosyltransferase-isomerase [Candidatus Kentron sp. H]
MSLTFGDFAYDAPNESFANDFGRPLSEIKLLVVDQNGEIHIGPFMEIIDFFQKGDHLVWNDVGISESRLSGITEPDGVGIDISFQIPQDDFVWEVVIFSDTGMPPESGEFSLLSGTIKGEFLGKDEEFDGGYWIKRNTYQAYRGKVKIDHDEPALRALLEQSGKYMHPWYNDLNSYSPEQLNPVITEKTGAALLSEPSRRFSQPMIDELTNKGVEHVKVSLYMNFSWNVPQADVRLSDYHMNEERIVVGESAVESLQRAMDKKNQIISIGTSGVRALESIDKPLHPFDGKTDIFISPEHEMKYCDALLTNLHNTMDTHLIMAAAFCRQERIMAAYDRAVKEKMRFGIFGDSMLVFK